MANVNLVSVEGKERSGVERKGLQWRSQGVQSRILKMHYAKILEYKAMPFSTFYRRYSRNTGDIGCNEVYRTERSESIEFQYSKTK